MQLRCVCLDLKFMDLLRHARQRGITSVEQLSAETRCGTKCGSCRPLLDELLRTGCVTLCGQKLRFPDPLDTDCQS